MPDITTLFEGTDGVSRALFNQKLSDVNKHGNDGMMHVTEAEREKWNDGVITPVTHTRTGTANNLVVPASAKNLTFLATADIVDGDTWTVNGQRVTAVLQNGEPLPGGLFKAGCWVTGVYWDGTRLGFNTAGGNVKYNLFCQPTQPIKKDGIWIQCQANFNKIVTKSSFSTGLGWTGEAASAIPINPDALSGNVILTIAQGSYVFILSENTSNYDFRGTFYNRNTNTFGTAFAITRSVSANPYNFVRDSFMCYTKKSDSDIRYFTFREYWTNDDREDAWLRKPFYKVDFATRTLSLVFTLEWNNYSIVSTYRDLASGYCPETNEVLFIETAQYNMNGNQYDDWRTNMYWYNMDTGTATNSHLLHWRHYRDGRDNPDSGEVMARDWYQNAGFRNAYIYTSPTDSTVWYTRGPTTLFRITKTSNDIIILATGQTATAGSGLINGWNQNQYQNKSVYLYQSGTTVQVALYNRQTNSLETVSTISGVSSSISFCNAEGRLYIFNVASQVRYFSFDTKQTVTLATTATYPKSSAPSGAYLPSLQIILIFSSRSNSAGFILNKEGLPDGTLAIQTEEFSNKYALISGTDFKLDSYFKNIWKIENGEYKEYPTYIGNGTSWVKFKN